MNNNEYERTLKEESVAQKRGILFYLLSISVLIYGISTSNIIFVLISSLCQVMGYVLMTVQSKEYLSTYIKKYLIRDFLLIYLFQLAIYFIKLIKLLKMDNEFTKVMQANSDEDLATIVSFWIITFS